MKNTFHRLIAGLIAASVLLCGCSSANMLTSAAAHELYDQRYSVGTASDEVNADFDDFTREIFTESVRIPMSLSSMHPRALSKRVKITSSVRLTLNA